MASILSQCVKITTTAIDCCLSNHVVFVAGTLCDENINECDPFPCFVEGTNPNAGGSTRGCFNLIGDYSCACIDGFQGKNCSVRILFPLILFTPWACHEILICINYFEEYGVSSLYTKIPGTFCQCCKLYKLLYAQFRAFNGDHFVFVPNHWETTLQCNVVSFAQRINRMIPGDHVCMRPANGVRRYNVTSSLVGWVHKHSDPWFNTSCAEYAFGFPIIRPYWNPTCINLVWWEWSRPCMGLLPDAQKWGLCACAGNVFPATAG